MTSEWELLAVAIMLLTIPMHSIASKMNILFFIIVFCYRTFAEFSTRRELSFILILLCAKLHNNSVISNVGIQKSLFLGIALHILHRQSLVSDSEFLSLPFCPTRKLSPFRAVCILYFIFPLHLFSSYVSFCRNWIVFLPQN